MALDHLPGPLVYKTPTAPASLRERACSPDRAMQVRRGSISTDSVMTSGISDLFAGL